MYIFCPCFIRINNILCIKNPVIQILCLPLNIKWFGSVKLNLFSLFYYIFYNPSILLSEALLIIYRSDWLYCIFSWISIQKIRICRVKVSGSESLILRRIAVYNVQDTHTWIIFSSCFINTTNAQSQAVTFCTIMLLSFLFL